MSSPISTILCPLSSLTKRTTEGLMPNSLHPPLSLRQSFLGFFTLCKTNTGWNHWPLCLVPIWRPPWKEIPYFRPQACRWTSECSGSPPIIYYWCDGSITPWGFMSDHNDVLDTKWSVVIGLERVSIERSQTLTEFSYTWWIVRAIIYNEKTWFMDHTTRSEE